ncbi:unnamed protein product [Ambrosiozyma monospora]|uniref:Unnamed protein product n=1 Tax=Ambrosiozyma monospora TaxID=43982 RepID=A0ACB5UC52_AMBMO|nr:unnamed protein product [Ambrosiozyma monospora]
MVCTQQVHDVVPEPALNKITQCHRSPQKDKGYESKRMMVDRSMTSSVLAAPRFPSIPIAASRTYSQAPTDWSVNSGNFRRDADISRFSNSSHSHNSSHMINESYHGPHIELESSQVPISSAETSRDQYMYASQSQTRQEPASHLRRLTITTSPHIRQFSQRQSTHRMSSLASPAQLTNKGAYPRSYITHSDTSYTTPITPLNIRNEHSRWENPNTQLYHNSSQFNRPVMSLGYGFPTSNSLTGRQYSTTANYQRTPLQVDSTQSPYQSSHNKESIPIYHHQNSPASLDRVALNKGSGVLHSTHHGLTEEPSQRRFSVTNNINSNKLPHSHQGNMGYHHPENREIHQTPATPILATQQTPMQTTSANQSKIHPMNQR